MATLVDIHTHQKENKNGSFLALRNVIWTKDAIPHGTLCSVGIHPWYLPSEQPPSLSLFEQAATEPYVWAVGECGLDKNSDCSFDEQIFYFRAQIAVANQINKPLIIHCVRSYQECMELLETTTNRVPVIFHGFAKNKILAGQLLKKGYYLSIGQQVLQGKHDEMLKAIPLDKIFFETDDHPLEIGDIYHYFCRVRKIALADLSEQVCKNFYQVFKHTIEHE